MCTQKEGFVIGMRCYAGNPYDGHTLDDMLCQAEAINVIEAKTAVVDLDYRGRHETKVKFIHRGKKLCNRDKKRLRRRSMLEAVIATVKAPAHTAKRCDSLSHERLLDARAGLVFRHCAASVSTAGRRVACSWLETEFGYQIHSY